MLQRCPKDSMNPIPLPTAQPGRTARLAGSPALSAHPAPVAQISNLLYSRFPIGRPLELPGVVGSAHARRVGNPRHSGLETCATAAARQRLGVTPVLWRFPLGDGLRRVRCLSPRKAFTFPVILCRQPVWKGV